MIVVMVLTETQTEQLFSLIAETGLKVFHTRTPVEYGYTGQ
jgi:hypothetical protein